jgi:hypothetical protein
VLLAEAEIAPTRRAAMADVAQLLARALAVAEEQGARAVAYRLDCWTHAWCPLDRTFLVAERADRRPSQGDRSSSTSRAPTGRTQPAASRNRSDPHPAFEVDELLGGDPVGLVERGPSEQLR